MEGQAGFRRPRSVRAAVKEGAQVDAEKIVATYPGMPPAMRASMAKDLAAGRKLELDGIAGPVLRGGDTLRSPDADDTEPGCDD